MKTTRFYALSIAFLSPGLLLSYPTKNSNNSLNVPDPVVSTFTLEHQEVENVQWKT
jgi:hypothetical protein